MAALKYRDEHNKVGFLEKPKGSADYHQVLDFLRGSQHSWDQFGSSLAIALICLTEGRRFLQMILEIEPKITKQYHAFKLTSKMFANMRLNFQGDHMPLLDTMLPPAQAAIAGESSGEAAPSNPQTVPETITEPDHSHDHESTPPRPTTTTSSAPVNEQGPSSDPNIASSSRPHESAPDLFTSTNVEDETMGGSFHTSPPSSTQAPPEGTPSGGAEDLYKLTTLSSLVFTLVQKVNTQESELKAHKLLFQEVVGKLGKKVKLLEDKLKGRKRKFVMTNSDKEEDAEQDVDPLIKLAKAAATAAAASAIPTGGSHEANIPPSSSIPSDEFAGGSDVSAGATTGPSANPSNKGKSPLLEEDPPVRERTFRQREEDRLGEEAARSLYEEEQDELEREREEMQRKRQQDVLNSAKYYTDSDWTDIMGQVHANQGLTADLLGPNVNEDNFAERMVALIAKKRRDFATQRTALAELQYQNIRRSLKRHCADLEQASSKKSKPTEAPKRKSLGARKKSFTDLDLTADDRSFIRVLFDYSDDSNDDDDTLFSFWPCICGFLFGKVVVGYLLVLGDVNLLYFMVMSASKYFTHPQGRFLHLLIGKICLTLYGMVVRYYEEHASRWLSDNLNQNNWVIWSWRFVPFSGVHVLETISGKILLLFADTPYPLSAQLMKKMLKHKLEKFVMTDSDKEEDAEQDVDPLIKLAKAAAAASAVPSA
ncbi:hypothetical protein Tco_1345910 [Tanacetum coccineum]